MILRKIYLAVVAFFAANSVFASASKGDNCNMYPETDAAGASTYYQLIKAKLG